MAKIIAVCRSDKKGTRKENENKGVFQENFGLIGDAHADINTHLIDGTLMPGYLLPKQDLEIGKTIFAALQNDLGDYVEGLTRSLNYVITDCQGANLQKILLAGAAAHTRNLDQYLAEQFGLPVQIILHPVLTEIVHSLPETRAQSGNWTTALGLALKQMEQA